MSDVIGVVGEAPITFACDGNTLVGILHLASPAPSVGMVLVVGGPQYRAGSHRQFVLLARYLASRGIAVLRFDCRGMGDSEGEFLGFERIEPDIAAAVDAMMGELPSLSRVVLWGLCDATLAICAHARRDPRVAGVALVNPWVRTEAGHARAQLKHYYLQRLIQRNFLRKVFKGEFNPVRSVRALWQNLASAVGSSRPPPGGFRVSTSANPLAQRMAADLRQFRGHTLIILSGRDLTAKEFDDVTRSATQWQEIYAEKRVRRRDIAAADHTFSHPAWRDQVAEWTWDWIKGLAL